jgi:replication factor A1
MKINELVVNQKIDELEAEVVEVSPVKEFSKFGRVGKVASATIKDETGEVQLTLWDDQTAMLKEGDKIKVTGAYVKEWQGQKQINVSRQGKIEII